jgi:hypothetical protein
VSRSHFTEHACYRLHLEMLTTEHWSVQYSVRRVSRYQRGNQNSYIEEEQTTQWSKEKYKRTNNDQQNIHIKLKIE